MFGAGESVLKLAFGPEPEDFFSYLFRQFKLQTIKHERELDLELA